MQGFSFCLVLIGLHAAFTASFAVHVVLLAEDVDRNPASSADDVPEDADPCPFPVLDSGRSLALVALDGRSSRSAMVLSARWSWQPLVDTEQA